MMRAVLMFIPMTIFAAMALDVGIPALFLLVCVLAGRAAASARGWGGGGKPA